MAHASANERTESERWLEAWPNPSKDRVVLTYPREANGIGNIQIFNQKGQPVHSFTAGDVGFEEVNLSGWPAGIYIVKLIVEGKDFETIKLSVVK